MKKKTYLIIIILILIITSISLHKEKDNYIYSKIMPTNEFNQSYYKDIEIKNNTNTIKNYNLIIEIIDINKKLLNQNFIFILAKKSNYDESYYEIQRTEASNLTTSPLTNTLYFTISSKENAKEYYRVYFWYSDKHENNTNLFIKYDIKINEIIENKNKENTNKKCNDITNPPITNNELIPVKIDDNGNVRTISNNNQWYNYCEKRWANSVLVKKDVRNKYKNNDNIQIDKNDILAYFVWIPRYSYKVWTTKIEENKYGQEQEIEIKFINKNQKDTKTKLNNWHTHPAFTFGNTELSGIWVGKFEITGKIDSPTILPNETPIVDYTLGDYFKSSLLLAGGIIKDNKVSYLGNEEYGLSKNSNSLIIKNSHWGAITYLSHSKYGTNDKIRINNYFNKINMTGCGAKKGNEESSNICDIKYASDTKEYPQSTTGNITGIFDLTGGTGEYVMSYLDGGNNLSGLNDNWFLEKSNHKYYDLYSSKTFNKNYNENIANCKYKTCMGHALYETFNWYMTIHNFSDKNYNFIKRGCGNFSSHLASQFCFGYATGEGGKGTSSRIVLITEN